MANSARKCFFKVVPVQQYSCLLIHHSSSITHGRLPSTAPDKQSALLDNMKEQSHTDFRSSWDKVGQWCKMKRSELSHMPINILCHSGVIKALNVPTFSGKAFIFNRSHSNYLALSSWSGWDTKAYILITDEVRSGSLRVLCSSDSFPTETRTSGWQDYAARFGSDAPWIRESFFMCRWSHYIHMTTMQYL